MDGGEGACAAVVVGAFETVAVAGTPDLALDACVGVAVVVAFGC